MNQIVIFFIVVLSFGTRFHAYAVKLCDTEEEKLCRNGCFDARNCTDDGECKKGCRQECCTWGVVSSHLIGIMGAMSEEIESLLPEIKFRTEEEHGQRTYYSGVLFGQRVVVVFSRWGKVAAASTATALLELFGCDELIFTGVAGALAPGLNVGDVVVADRLVQWDMDSRPLYPQYEIPLLNVTFFRTDEWRRYELVGAAESFLENGLNASTTEEQRQMFGISDPKVVVGLVASGDTFVSDAPTRDVIEAGLPGVQCAEMEGAAVAQVCYEHNISCSVVRTISDDANEDAQFDFQEFVNDIATVYSNGILKLALSSK